MPNFWTKTTQYFDEAFKGPRTIDIEFDGLIKEMNDIEKGMAILKQVLAQSKSFSSAFKTYFNHISDALRNIFNKNSPFYSIIENILDVHRQLEIRCDVYTQVMMRLLPKTTEWNNFFQQTKQHLDNREKARKEFDHYDSKMEAMYRNKSKKVKKRDYLERNQDKFCQSAIKYIEISEEAYHAISDIMNRRYEMINPVLVELIVEQREFFETEGEINMKLNKIEDRFNQVQKSNMLYVRKDYNAGKYIRGGLLLHKETNIKRRFTTEDLKKSFIFGKQQSCGLLGFELTPAKDKNTYKYRKKGLFADTDQAKDFYWIPDVFSGVSTRFAKQSKKNKELIKRSYTEPNLNYNPIDAQFLNYNEMKHEEDSFINDFF